jgi:hypothetical protein
VFAFERRPAQIFNQRVEQDGLGRIVNGDKVASMKMLPLDATLSADSDIILIHCATSHPAFALYRRPRVCITLGHMPWRMTTA